GRRVVQPVEYRGGPQVVVLKDDFTEQQIDRDGAVNGIRIANRANRLTSHIDGRPALRRGGVYGSLLQRIEQMGLLQRGNTGSFAGGLPLAHLSRIGQLLDGNQSSARQLRRKFRSFHYGQAEEAHCDRHYPRKECPSNVASYAHKVSSSET